MVAMNRRQFVKRGMLGAAALAAVEGLVREPRHPIGEEVEVRLRRLPEAFDGFRLAQISDIHFGPFMGKEGVERGLEVAKSLRPDFVALTGDFVSHSLGKAHGADGAHHAEPCADVLAQWKNIPMLAILGNHDHWNGADIVTGALRERGIRVLPKTLGGIPPSEATVLLAHEPDFADYAATFPVDLQLSGHSHGGQVRLPGIGPIVLPEMAKKYHTGLNRVGTMQVYTNWGLGMITPPVRFLCPPKVTVFVLRRG
jgi:uncharacterized protein